LGDGANFRAVIAVRNDARRVAVFFSHGNNNAAETLRAGVHIDNSRLARVDAVDVAVLRRLRTHGHESRFGRGDNIFHAHGGARGGAVKGVTYGA